MPITRLHSSVRDMISLRDIMGIALKTGLHNISVLLQKPGHVAFGGFTGVRNFKRYLRHVLSATRNPPVPVFTSVFKASCSMIVMYKENAKIIIAFDSNRQ